MILLARGEGGDAYRRFFNVNWFSVTPPEER